MVSSGDPRRSWDLGGVLRAHIPYPGSRRRRITDRAGNILIVEPTYTDHWEDPGGVVELGESPAVACARELDEEFGLDLQLGRLLVIEYQTEAQPRGDSVMFVYDGGVLEDPGKLRLAAGELRSFAFIPAENLQLDYGEARASHKTCTPRPRDLRPARAGERRPAVTRNVVRAPGAISRTAIGLANHCTSTARPMARTG